MTSAKDLLFAVLIAAHFLQHLPPSVGDDFLSPLLAPIQEEACEVMECGKGSCKSSGNVTFPYECDCDSGWSQFHDNKFLPCVIPNCSLDTSCMKGDSGLEEKPTNTSIFNPCHWADCGGGSCNRTSLFSYHCLCDDGYYNLMNVSVFPCLKECAIGLDCASLGISTSNKTASPPPTVADNGGKDASSVKQRGCSLWLFTLMLLLFVLQRS